MRSNRLLILLLVLLPILSIGQDSKLYTFLKSIPGAEVKKADSSVWTEYYILMLPQPVDHNHPDGAWFKQRIFVGHRGYDRPTVMETEGYGAEFMTGFLVDEPAQLLNANQLYVEHRYFGESVPAKLEWKYLTVEQDAADYHAIRRLFAQIYPGKWITTGVSKGGQSAMEYKVFYPEDVDVTIPYVAPLNYSLIDKRIEKHFRKVGTKANREQIRDIQIYLLKNKKTTLPLYKEICTYQGYAFTEMDAETAFDYSVLEMPFSFWQYTADCSKLPDLKNTSPEKVVAFLVRIVSPFWYTAAAHQFDAANYQFYTQLGFYEYDEWPFRKYLKLKDYPNSAFSPKGAEVKWDGSYVHKLKRFMKNNPTHIIFIYGECDPWGATGAKLKPGKGSVKVVKAQGTHGTTIRTLDPDQQEEVINALKLWLGMELQIDLKSN